MGQTGPNTDGSCRHVQPDVATKMIAAKASRSPARKPGTRGFTPIPKRWAVERTYGWLMLNRRLARDYETLIHLAMTGLMARRLTSENTISWRDLKKATQHPISG
ncbi:hypothetical protein J3A78_000075 [Streptomyces sp. PvR006]|nr:hypothetical protein [Streptomyces sp. PvR006]